MSEPDRSIFQEFLDALRQSTEKACEYIQGMVQTIPPPCLLIYFEIKTNAIIMISLEQAQNIKPSLRATDQRTRRISLKDGHDPSICQRHALLILEALENLQIALTKWEKGEYNSIHV